MATGHSILDTLNATSKGAQPSGPSGKFRTKDLPIDQLYRNQDNFYGIVEVEELAGMILTSGLLENLAVVYDPTPEGQYRIVSGERRWEALKLLVSRGHKEFTVATCNIRAKRSHEEEMVALIAANSQRVKSIPDQIMEYKTMKATLETMKATGQTLEGYDLESGKLRPVIADILRKSETKLAQIERIDTHLIPELRALLDTGSLKFSAAYALAGKDEDDQRAAYQRATETGREIAHKDVAPRAPRGEERTESACEQSDRNPCASAACERMNGACEHWGVIKANFVKHGEIQGCAGCCECCVDRKTCDFRCGVVAQKDQTKAQAPRPEPATEANPKTVTSRCFSCANWDACPDKNDKTTACDQYRNKNTVAAPPAAGPCTTYREQRREFDKDRLVETIRFWIARANLPEDEKEACLDLYDDMVEIWGMMGMNDVE